MDFFHLVILHPTADSPLLRHYVFLCPCLTAISSPAQDSGGESDVCGAGSGEADPRDESISERDCVRSDTV